MLLSGLLVGLLAMPVSAVVTTSVAWAQVEPAESTEVKKSKKKRRKRRKKKAKKAAPTPPPVPTTPAKVEPAPAEVEPTPAPEPDAKLQSNLTQAGGSVVTPGTASRWSNAGAMTPIIADVPIAAPLPERAIPLAPGAATPGQRLTGEEDQLSAHLSLSGYHLETVRQDADYVDDKVVPRNRDIDLYRARATMGYERIAGSWFAAHLDVEYRAKSSGTRPTDRRLNAAYVSWGLTDFRRDDAPRFGVALGRIAVREAGYAQTDGALARLRLLPELQVGAFGGVSGNPYVYNWRLKKTDDFSADWITGGAFASYRARALYANLAGVVYVTSKGAGGVDRVSVFLDSGWTPRDDLDLFFTGWFDVLPDGQPLTNVEVIGSWTPSRQVNLRLSLARFSTITYETTTNISFFFDPTGNRIETVDGAQVFSSTAVDENGNPINAYDGALLVAAYTAARLRGGYRFDALGLEPFATFDLYLRDPKSPPAEPFATVRMLPGVGALYRNAKFVDARVRVVGLIDEQTDTKAILSAGVSRALFGVRVGADARAFIGGTFAADGGVDVAYRLPLDQVPGRVLLRAMFRYYREDVELARPFGQGILEDDEVLPLVPLQESYMGFAGVDWRL